MSRELLAERTCLSLAQVTQLEEDGDRGFYTAAIKARAGRRAEAAFEALSCLNRRQGTSLASCNSGGVNVSHRKQP